MDCTEHTTFYGFWFLFNMKSRLYEYYTDYSKCTFILSGKKAELSVGNDNSNVLDCLHFLGFVT